MSTENTGSRDHGKKIALTWVCIGFGVVALTWFGVIPASCTKKMPFVNRPFKEYCYDCDGTGKARHPCNSCNGRGFMNGVRCQSCFGTGKVERTCKYCGGSGRIPPKN